MAQSIAAAPHRHLPLALTVIGGWALLALVWTPATTLVERGAQPWPAVFLFVLLGFVPWMAATPLIVALARRFPIERGRLPNLAVHALAGAILIPLIALTGRMLATGLTGMGAADPARMVSAALIVSLYSVPTYVAVAAIAQGIARIERGQRAAAPAHPRRLAIRERGRTELLDTHAIDYVDVAGHYLCVHVGETVHVTRGQLKDLEASLDPREFARIHRSTLVRLDRVKALTERRNGDCDLILADGRQLLLSRTYRDSLQARLGL